VILLTSSVVPKKVTGAYRLGVLAFGDSITNGAGTYHWGVALQSWAMWVARGLGLPYTPYAVDGAIATDVVNRQLPLWRDTAAHPDGRYDLGCVYIGTNDVRRQDWDRARFESELATIHLALAERCERRLAITLPLNLARPPRPRTRAKVEEANAAITRAAAANAALLLDLSAFRGRNLMMADEVHPTALGQVAIAERALAVLAADGMQVRVPPSELISYGRSWWGHLRGDATYTYQHLKVSGVAALRAQLSREALGRRPR
jgi:lysophospholipase L1-like esterase